MLCRKLSLWGKRRSGDLQGGFCNIPWAACQRVDCSGGGGKWRDVGCILEAEWIDSLMDWI